MIESHELTHALHTIAHAINDAVQEQKVQFSWMVQHHFFATKNDIEKLNADLSMKLSEIKTAIATASRTQKEALAEIGTQIADLKKQIDDLKNDATDPDVTDAEFLQSITTLQTDAQALADIVPGSPTPPENPPAPPAT